MAKAIKAAPDYGNWVSRRIIYLPAIVGIALLASTFLFWALIIPGVLFVLITSYFAYARYLFSPKGKNVQNQIWDLAISNLDWKGDGKALDIGCGNGALTIKLASKLSLAQVTGIDFWGER